MIGNIEKIIGVPFNPINFVKFPPAPVDHQIRDAMERAGIEPPSHIEIDGQIHRFSIDKKKDKPGWYVFFNSGVTVGTFGDWRSGNDGFKFVADVGRDLTQAEHIAIANRMAEAKKARQLETEKTHEVAANVVDRIWSGCDPATPDHPYLKRKGVQPHGARVTGDGRLVLPVFDEDGVLASLQYISDSGDKKFHSGGETKGNYMVIGLVDGYGPLYVAEGLATAATIHEQTGRPCVVAYNANNLSLVMGRLRNKHGISRELVIVADNDESGVGKKCAEEAIAKHGGRYVLPPIEGDANDFWIQGGDLKGLLETQPTVEWLVPADSFCEQPAPIKWLVKNWLQENALIMVHGPSGGGKTFVVLDMCLRMAAGMDDWIGNKVKAGNVVYLAGEGHQGLRGRVAAWKQNYQVDHFNMWISQTGLDLNTAEGYAKVANNLRCLETMPSVIVVDTLHRFLNGDENSAQDAKTMLDACANLMSEFGCSVILVHHTGVSDEAQHRARGSSAWRGALDIEISIIPSKDGSPMEIVQRKSKDAELAHTLFGRLESVPINGWFDEDGDQVTSAILVPEDAPSKLNKRSQIETTFIAAYKVCAEAGNGIVNNGEFIGIDKEVLREFFYDMEGMAGKSIEAKKKAYARVRDDFGNNDLYINGNILKLNTNDVTINEKRWVELFNSRQGQKDG